MLEWLGVYDIPNSRSVHKKKVLRMGGLIFISGYFASLLYILFFQSPAISDSQFHAIVGILGGAVCIAILGAIDDLIDLHSTTKFLIQCVIAVMLCHFDMIIREISILGISLELGVFAVPFTVFWVVGIINAVNLMDGLDGLAAGLSFIILATLALQQPNDLIVTMIIPGLLGGLVVFLRYNFHPARIFMGDIGSLFLGYHLAVLSIVVISFKTATLGMMAPVFLLGLPVVDTLLAIFRRAKAGKFVFAADKSHIHHQLLSLGVSHRNVVLILYLICSTLAAVVHFGSQAGQNVSAMILFGTGILITILIYSLVALQKIFENGRISGSKRGMKRAISLYLKANSLHELDHLCDKKIQELELEDLETILLQIFYDKEPTLIQQFIQSIQTHEDS